MNLEMPPKINKLEAHKLGVAESKLLKSCPTNMEIPTPQIKNLLEAKPPKSTLFVRELTVLL